MTRFTTTKHKKHFNPTPYNKEPLKKDNLTALPLRFKKNQNNSINDTLLCFRCRKSGHLMTKCPEISESNDKMKKVCYQCGSNDGHSSSNCPAKTRFVAPGIILMLLK